MREKHQLSWGEPGLRLDPDGSLAFILRQCLTIDSTLLELRVNPVGFNPTSDSNLNLGCSRFSRFDGETWSKRRLFTVFRVSWVGSTWGLFLRGVESDKNPESSLNPSTTISIYIFSLFLFFCLQLVVSHGGYYKSVVVIYSSLASTFDESLSLFRHWEKRLVFWVMVWGGGHFFS